MTGEEKSDAGQGEAPHGHQNSHHEEKVREVLRTLDRTRRQAPRESATHKTRRKSPAGRNAAPAGSKKSPASPTIAEILQTWAANSRWPNNRIAAEHVIRAIGHLKPHQLNSLMVGAIVATWRKNLRPSSAYTYRYKFGEMLRLLQTFGAPRLIPPKIPPPANRAVTAKPDELGRLLTTARPFLRLFVLLYLQCGLRFSEAIAVTPRTWNPLEHTVTVKVKGGHQRTAQVSPDVEILFASAMNADPDRSFIEALHGKPITPSGIREAWKRLLRDTGTNPAVTAHDLRRTAATILYNATKDLRIAQQLLGHKQLTSTLRYLAPLAPEEARRYAELLSFDKFQSEVRN